MNKKREPFWGTTSHGTIIHLFVWDVIRQMMVPACRLHQPSRPTPKRVWPVDGWSLDHPATCPSCARRVHVYSKLVETRKN
jgi:hypothetical protein